MTAAIIILAIIVVILLMFITMLIYDVRKYKRNYEASELRNETLREKLNFVVAERNNMYNKLWKLEKSKHGNWSKYALRQMSANKINSLIIECKQQLKKINAK